MRDRKINFGITILEDNEYYNRMLVNQVRHFTDQLGFYLKCKFQISTFTNKSDFVANLSEDTDLAILDFYLGDGTNSLPLIQTLKNKTKDCKIALISSSNEVLYRTQQISNRIDHYIFKDKSSIPRACFFIEDIVYQRISKA